MPTNSVAKRGRGRPAFKPTAAQKRQVSIAAAGGMRHDDIAIAMGVCRDTLSKYFEAELSAGAAARRMEVLQALFIAAKKGSSSAARAFLAADPTLGIPPLPEGAQPAVAQAPVAAVTPKRGKKEQAQADAQTAAQGTEWDHLLGGVPGPMPLQ